MNEVFKTEQAFCALAGMTEVTMKADEAVDFLTRSSTTALTAKQVEQIVQAIPFTVQFWRGQGRHDFMMYWLQHEDETMFSTLFTHTTDFVDAANSYFNQLKPEKILQRAVDLGFKTDPGQTSGAGGSQ